VDLWNTETLIEDIEGLDVDLPNWLEDDISAYDVAAICRGGCASGAYMPAVTYYKALATMQGHVDEVLQYIEDAIGELPNVTGQSWGQIGCTYLSTAVDLWASSVESELEAFEPEDVAA
jgi:hypothetical protein